jgi:hypothetical protein
MLGLGDDGDAEWVGVGSLLSEPVSSDRVDRRGPTLWDARYNNFDPFCFVLLSCDH